VNSTGQPDQAPYPRVTVDDIRAVVGGATPHFALQIRDRVRRMIEPLPSDHPTRIEGERAIARLERLAKEGQTSGTVQEHERPLPSLGLAVPGGEPSPRTGDRP
jgi:hypothetical protein